MVYHRQTKIKDENGKHLIQPTEYEKRRRKVKHLSKYINKIKNAELSELPHIVSALYSYAINKSIIQDNEFLKNELITQIEILKDAYQHQYPPEDFRAIQNRYLKEMANFNKSISNANFIAKYYEKSFFTAKFFISKIKSLQNNTIRNFK